uniref:Uncharacterized protein n=1 Tax=Oryza brachyantha TaxID=4533 RepID=J3NAH6_ORYBR
MGNPEDFFWEALLKENEAPSPPPVFFEAPTPLTNRDGEDPSLLDNQLLSYISRMLMEDETGSAAAAKLQRVDRGSTEDLLPGTEVVRAFLKGMEEASKFLPRNNGFGSEETVQGHGMGRRKKNHDRDEQQQQLEEEVGSSSKLAALTIAAAEATGAREMLDELMLHGHETCIKDMEKLRVDMDKEAEKKSSSSKVVDLRMLLIDSQQCAGQVLKKIRQHSSATGDAMQRVAHCFAKGLEARLDGSGRQLYQSRWRMSLVEYLKVYKLYMSACSFKKVALLFAAMTIMHAVQGKQKLHIVDYGDCGLHWPDLFRRLGSREGGPPEVRITIVDIPQPGFRPAQRIEASGRCLSSCAKELGVPFRFQAVAAAKWETVGADDLHIDPDEVLVVNDLLSFSVLMDESVFSEGPSPRDVALRNIGRMRADVVFIQGIANANHGASFLSRFRGALLYYSALFDMLDATVPRGSELRLALEQNILGPYALNAIACEGADLVERPEKYRQWQARNHRAGMQQLPLRPEMLAAISDEVKRYHHKDFLLCEDGQWLLQGWMGRVLFAHSAWVP